jgi:hypothetical protein
LISSSADTSLHINPLNRNLYVNHVGKNYPPYINISKFLIKWNNSYTLLYNLFYNNASILVFTNKTLKLEANAFNWSFFSFDHDLFKLASPYFTIKMFPYGEFAFYLKKAFAKYSLLNTFILDVPYHEKSIKFLQRADLYTIGLIPLNVNP